MEFYEQYYGQRDNAPVVDTALKMLARHCRLHGDLSILDIGSGSMAMTGTFVDHFRSRNSSPVNIKLTGWDISRTGVERAREQGYDCHQKDICAALDPQDENQADLVLFFEVLEHIVDTDNAIINIRKILKDDGYLLLSTPNLASWYNRLFLLFGFQPHCTEVSSVPVRFGSRFIHRLLGEKEGQASSIAGHLRVFTWKALREFLEYHGFEIVQAAGCANHSWDLVTRTFCRVSKGLAGDICVLARKKK